MDNPRLELRIEDGIEYVKKTREIFDVVIVDSTSLSDPGLFFSASLFMKKSLPYSVRMA